MRIERPSHPWSWSVSATAAMIVGFKMKDIVLGWSPFQAYWEQHHLSIVVASKRRGTGSISSSTLRQGRQMLRDRFSRSDTKHVHGRSGQEAVSAQRGGSPN